MMMKKVIYSRTSHPEIPVESLRPRSMGDPTLGSVAPIGRMEDDGGSFLANTE